MLKGRLKTNLVFQTTFLLSLCKKCGQVPKRFSNFKNFKIFAHAVDLGLFNKVMPQANQIEINPFQQKTEAVAALQAEGIAVEAWAPFAEGKNDIFHNPVLSKINTKYGKSVAQVITRWLIERDMVVLAKSTKPERMAENLNVFDFALSDEDKAEIAKLDGTFAAIVNHDTVDNLKRISAWKMGV